MWLPGRDNGRLNPCRMVWASYDMAAGFQEKPAKKEMPERGNSKRGDSPLFLKDSLASYIPLHSVG